ncbi:MAG: cupin-like domain-containing protein [Thermoanaerobaculia bacterium]
MKILDNIPRIAKPSVARFKDYLFREEPVIITDLYRSQPIERLATSEAAAAAIGGMPLQVGLNPYGSHRYRRDSIYLTRFDTTLGEFLDRMKKIPDLPFRCVEFPTPATFRSLFKLPDLADINRYDPPVSKIYVANRGQSTSMHFDGDHRHVLFTQVFGRKRIALIPPRYSKRLFPYGDLTTMAVHNFPEEEKHRFFRFNDARECTLHPGETLLMPKLWWHYIEHIDVTMSFNVRFAQTPYDKRLSYLPIEYHLQNIAPRLVDPRTVTLRHERVYRRLLYTYFGKHATPYRRFLSYETALKESYAEVCPDALQGEFVGDFYSKERADLVSLAKRWKGIYCLRLDMEAIPLTPDSLKTAAALQKIPLEALRRFLKSLKMSSDLRRLSEVDLRMLLNINLG